MKLLVVTSEPITAAQLCQALPDDIDPAQTEVMVVAPALQESTLKFWFSDADEAIARAEEVRAQTVEALDREGVRAAGETGESDPLQAIQDALQTFPAQRIVLFTHGDGDAAGYREDVDAAEVQERFGVPVDRATVGG
jgi:hypothetical protein